MDLKETTSTSRVERKKEETKQKIIKVAMQLFRDQGFDVTTMEQIAGEADIAKGTLYNYFPVKEAILDENIKRSFTQRNAEWLPVVLEMPDTRSRLTYILARLIEGVQSQKTIFERYHAYRVKNMISLQQDETVESGIGVLSTEIIRLGQEKGEIRNDIPLDILLDLFEFVFIEVAMQLYKSPETFDPRQSIERSVDLFLNGAKRNE